MSINVNISVWFSNRSFVLLRSSLKLKVKIDRAQFPILNFGLKRWWFLQPYLQCTTKWSKDMGSLEIT
jgi:hypothetical protein